MIELELPYPPSLNHYKTLGRLTLTAKGKLYQPRIDTTHTKRYYYEVWFRINHLKAKEGLKTFGSAKICMELDVYPPDARKRDLDNICKCSIDSLQRAGLFDDDYQIDRLVVQRMDIIQSGKLVVRIHELGAK